MYYVISDGLQKTVVKGKRQLRAHLEVLNTERRKEKGLKLGGVFAVTETFNRKTDIPSYLSNLLEV